MKTVDIEAKVSWPVYGHEEDYLNTEEGLVAFSTLFEKAGFSSIFDYSMVTYAFTSLKAYKLYEQQTGKMEDWMIRDSDFKKEQVRKYREETGRKYPPVFHVKIHAEIEELSEEEALKVFE